MRLDTGLRLSTYLTIALAGICLTYAEEPYFPGITFLAIPMGMLLVTAYFAEGKWSLSAPAANGIGMMISLGWIAWVVFFSSDFDDPLGRPVLPTVFLPYLGPLLMVLVLVKLFRPKGIRDYWYLHMIALIEVAVASVLVVEPQFGLWLLAYIVCAFWSMAIFCLHREATQVGLQNQKTPVLASSSTTPLRMNMIPWRHLGIWVAVRRATAVAALGLVLFLLTPQHGTTEAVSEMLGSKGQTGFANAAMDLNETGRVEVDESEAFEVYVENNDGSPKTNLSPMIRWRGLVMDHYSQGRWAVQPGYQRTYTLRGGQRALPHLGPDEFYITYHINTAQSHGFFLAEPVVALVKKEPNMMPEVRLPYVSLAFEGTPNRDQELFGYQQREDFVAGAVALNPIHVSYQQVVVPPPGDGLSRPSPLSPDKRDANPMEKTVTVELLDQPIEGIRLFTGDVLLQLVQQGKLTIDDVPRDLIAHLVRRGKLKVADLSDQLVARLVRDEKIKGDDVPGERIARLIQDGKLKKDDITQGRAAKNSATPMVPLVRVRRAKVARALSDYLASSGEYSYSLNLTREDRSLDPTEDFLRKVKEGHCERFATSLVLMLRSAGIPSRLIVGFRGADPKNPTNKEDGHYVIRQSHAHAWVEALVGTETPDKKMELRWLTLDPSPLMEADDKISFSWATWRENTLRQLRNFWRSYILEYNANQQSEAVSGIWKGSGLDAGLDALTTWVQREPYWLVGLTVVVVGMVWLRPRFSRGRRGNVLASETSFYHRLLRLFSRNCRLTPKVGQTPQEFGLTAQEFLASQNLGAALVELPIQVIHLYYQVRYGHLQLNPTQRQEIDHQLDQLSAALKKIPRIAN
jgi:hypothetical protein